MKFFATILTLVTLSISTRAFGFDLNCQTQDRAAAMHLVADSSDGSLDRLTITAFGARYGENSIATTWTEWKANYQIDDKVVKAVWPMRDGVTVQFDLKHVKNGYRGIFILTAADRKTVSLPMVCAE